MNLIVDIFQQLKDPGISLLDSKTDEVQIKSVPFGRREFRTIEREEFFR